MNTRKIKTELNHITHWLTNTEHTSYEEISQTLKTDLSDLVNQYFLSVHNKNAPAVLMCAHPADQADFLYTVLGYGHTPHVYHTFRDSALVLQHV